MDYLKAFLVGGSICLISQIFIDKTKITSGRLLVYLVVLGVILGGIGIYEPFVEFAGAGASVPITGFGFLLVNGVKLSIDKDGFSGIFTGGLTKAAAGLSTVIFLSLISGLIFNSKEK